MLTDDAGFLAAERELAELRQQREDFSARHHHVDPPEESWDRSTALEAQIATSPPVSFVTVAVKLRRLLDPEVGMQAGPCDTDLPSLRQILDFLEAVDPTLRLSPEEGGATGSHG